MTKIKNFLGRNLRSKRNKDKLSKKNRSSLMAKIKSSGTSFELRFFELMKNEDFKFDPHPSDVFGHPDFVIRGKKICVFLDSDFWHGWQYPRWKHKLKNKFWREKIEKNRKRDRAVTRILRVSGWIVIRLWEHNIKKLNFDFLSKIRRK